MPGAYPISFDEYEGIYEIPQAARFIHLAERKKWERAEGQGHKLYKVNSRHLIRWIRRGLALETLSDVPGRDLLITFEDLISMRIIAALRANGVSFALIYEMENWLRSFFGHPRPFAVEQLWTLPTRQRDYDDRHRAVVFAEFRDKLVAASHAGQSAFDFLRDYILPVHGLTFEDAVAAKWEPQDGVLMDPEIQFGAPCIKGTRIPTRTIWGMVTAGDTRSYVASSFRLQDEEVEAAMQWEDSLAPTRSSLSA